MVSRLAVLVVLVVTTSVRRACASEENDGIFHVGAADSDYCDKRFDVEKDRAACRAAVKYSEKESPKESLEDAIAMMRSMIIKEYRYEEPDKDFDLRKASARAVALVIPVLRHLERQLPDPLASGGNNLALQIAHLTTAWAVLHTLSLGVCDSMLAEEVCRALHNRGTANMC